MGWFDRLFRRKSAQGTLPPLGWGPEGAMVGAGDDPVAISPGAITHGILILDAVHGLKDDQLIDALTQILPSVEPEMTRELQDRRLMKRIKMGPAFFAGDLKRDMATALRNTLWSLGDGHSIFGRPHGISLDGGRTEQTVVACWVYRSSPAALVVSFRSSSPV